MDKEYMIEAVKARLNILKKRHRDYCVNKDGEKDLKPAVAQVYRTNTARDIKLLKLVGELLLLTQKNTALLTTEACEGFMRLTEPTERHRNS